VASIGSSHCRDQSDPRGNGECRCIRRLFHKEAKRQYPDGKREYETRDSHLPLSFHASNDLAFSGAPHAALGRDETGGGASAATLG